MDITWNINLQNGIVSSECGFVCQFHNNKISDIKNIPAHFTTTDIKLYSDEAIEQYQKAKEQLECAVS